jgi:hypothetical protein
MLDVRGTGGAAGRENPGEAGEPPLAKGCAGTIRGDAAVGHSVGSRLTSP